MKKIFLLILLLINNHSAALAKDMNCNEFKKFSLEYLKCKGSVVKNKTITAGKNIIKDTSEYQKKEWLKEKNKIDNEKDQIKKTKQKILD